MNTEYKNYWLAGFIALAVIAALGLWWFSWTQPISSATPGNPTEHAANTDTNTPGTGTGSTSGSTATNVVVPEDRSNATVVDIATSISGTSQFAALLQSTGVAATMTGAGPYTIFVPTDGAFQQLPSGSINGLSATDKKRLVEYHIISGRAVDTQAQMAGSMPALSGDALNFSYAESKIPMVNSAIIIKAYKAKNGMVYLIDNVLIPPTKTQ